MTVQALPETYSHYRPVKGDGNCGWRGKLPLPSTAYVSVQKVPVSSDGLMDLVIPDTGPIGCDILRG